MPPLHPTRAPHWIAWRENGDGQRFYPMLLQVKRETLMLHMGMWEAGRGVSEANLAAAVASGSETDLANCRHNLAGFLSRFGERERALELYHKAMDSFLSTGDELKAALAERNIGNIHKLDGRIEQAYISYRNAIGYFKSNGRHLELSETLSNLANIHADRREYKQAWALYQEAIALAREHGHLRSQANAIYNAASILTERGDLEPAMGMYQEALEIHGRIGDLSRIAYDIGSIGEIHLKVRKHQEALERFEEVERISLEVGDRYSVAYAHEFIGRTLHGLGRFEEALDRFRLQLQAAVSVGDAEREARAHGWLGIACAALGRAGEATAHLNRAVASSEALGSEFLLCEWHYHLAWLPPAAAGDVRGHNRRAAELAARMGRRDMSFLCGVQEAVIDFLESGDEMGRERAVDALRVMMEERNDKQGKARLYYECWRLLAEMGRDGDAAVMGRKAARLYSDLTEESDGAEYRDKLDRLRYGGIDI